MVMTLLKLALKAGLRFCRKEINVDMKKIDQLGCGEKNVVDKVVKAIQSTRDMNPSWDTVKRDAKQAFVQIHIPTDVSVLPKKLPLLALMIMPIIDNNIVHHIAGCD
jgi:hypothetical protein